MTNQLPLPLRLRQMADTTGLDAVAELLREAADALEQRDIRCECCGYMTHQREHLGCIRAALAQSKMAGDQLKALAVTILGTEGCERLRDWYSIGPVQRAALETFLGSAIKLAYTTGQQDAQGLTSSDVADYCGSQFRAGYASAKRGDPEPLGYDDDQDFLSGRQACDLSGEGTCEACQ